LAVGQGDASIRLWDTTDWQQKAALDGHESFAFHLQFAPDGHTLATSGNDGTVRFWLRHDD
jgi:WD40 repeat protein